MEEARVLNCLYTIYILLIKHHENKQLNNTTIQRIPTGPLFIHQRLEEHLRYAYWERPPRCVRRDLVGEAGRLHCDGLLRQGV